MLTWEEKLQSALDNFNVEKAEELSLELHHEQERGALLSEKAEMLWGKLTILIFRNRQGRYGIPDESVWSCMGCY